MAKKANATKSLYLEKTFVPFLYFIVVELCVGTEILKLLGL